MVHFGGTPVLLDARTIFVVVQIRHVPDSNFDRIPDITGKLVTGFGRIPDPDTEYKKPYA